MSDARNGSAAVDLTVQALRIAADATVSLPGLRALSDEYLVRASRLEQRQFTVALFGAFSAGKSSLANALLGNTVLPVSPNPTTAAINRISAARDEHSDRTALITWKTPAHILSDVQRSLAYFGEEAESLSEARTKIVSLRAEAASGGMKPHFTFLKAVATGLDTHVELLGTQSRVSLEAFRPIVSREEEASFVESVDLAYDCPLTRHGLVLVDTPGVDSLNARHTDVAFEYVRSADAIVFVTYFNHAFSRADKLFVEQLGRIKDSEVLDKVFFVVNAKDLAVTEDELAKVMGHVRKELTAHGAASPKMYAVSSQIALLARMHEQGVLAPSAERAYRARLGLTPDDLLPSASEALVQAGFQAFESSFRSFVQDELAGIAQRAARTELARATEMIQNYIDMATSAADVRDRQRTDLEQATARAIALVDQRTIAVELSQVDREIEELLYHIGRRYVFDFGTLFNEAFNPGVLSDAAGGDLRRALVGALRELLSDTDAVLIAGWRTSAVLAERVTERLIREWRAVLIESIRLELPQFSIPDLVWVEGKTPSMMHRVSSEAFDEVQAVLRHFRNSRHFFEGGGKALLREDVESRLQPFVTRFLEAGRNVLSEAMRRFAETVASDVRTTCEQAIRDHAASLRAALDQDLDLAALEMSRRRLLDAVDLLRTD